MGKWKLSAAYWISVIHVKKGARKGRPCTIAIFFFILFILLF